MTTPVEDRLRDLFEADAQRAPDVDTLAAGAVRRVRRRRLTQAGVAVICAVAVAGVLISVRPEATRAPIVAAPAASPTASSPAAASPTVTAPGDGLASCAFGPDERGLPRRAVAFDGTVIAIGPGRPDRPGAAWRGYVSATFHVNQWFKGGRGPTATVEMGRPSLGGIDSEYGPPPFDIGTRMLVSGDHRWGGTSFGDVYGQGCGFTRYYNAKDAALWQRVFG